MNHKHRGVSARKGSEKMRYMADRGRKIAICITLIVAVMLAGCSEASRAKKPATLDDLNDPSSRSED